MKKTFQELTIKEPFGDRLYRYTICNHCKENDKDVDDGDYTIWLSSKGNNVSEESGELVKFLQYVEDPEKESDSEGEFVKSLKEQIAAIKRNREWEGRFMLLEEMIAYEREEAMAEGHAKGLAEGEQLTLQKMNRLTQLLAKQNRIDDLVKAANDADYQEQLFKEFHL